MVKLIMGLKGSGKTKRLVELVREAVAMENGDVVCIEKEKKLTYDIPYQARLIEAGSYDIGSYEFIKGFICGLHSGNYDITHVLSIISIKSSAIRIPLCSANFSIGSRPFPRKKTLNL